MRKKEDAGAIVRKLLSAQRLAVLCTCGQAGPHASLMAFAATRDARRIIFATPRKTRKYANLKRNARVSVLVDERTLDAPDLRKMRAITSAGVAREEKGAERAKALRMLLRRHPELRGFADAPESAIFSVRVRSCTVVNCLQKVTELRFGR